MKPQCTFRSRQRVDKRPSRQLKAERLRNNNSITADRFRFDFHKDPREVSTIESVKTINFDWRSEVIESNRRERFLPRSTRHKLPMSGVEVRKFIAVFAITEFQPSELRGNKNWFIIRFLSENWESSLSQRQPLIRHCHWLIKWKHRSHCRWNETRQWNLSAGEEVAITSLFSSRINWSDNSIGSESHRRFELKAGLWCCGQTKRKPLSQKFDLRSLWEDFWWAEGPVEIFRFDLRELRGLSRRICLLFWRGGHESFSWHFER